MLKAPFANTVVAPEMVFVELTQQCNLSCSMCRGDSNGFSNNHMSESVFSILESELFKLAKMVDLRGWGESLPLDTFPNRVRRVVQCGTQVRIVTNLSISSPASLAVLADANAYISISLDAANADLLARARGGARLKQVQANIVTLRRLYAQARADFGRVSIGATVQDITIGHLSDLVSFAVTNGISKVSLFPRMNNGKLRACSPHNTIRLLEDLAEANERAERAGVSIRIGAKLWPEMQDPLPPWSSPCLKPWKYCFVGWDGKVGFCDFLIGPGWETHSIGQIRDKSPLEIWRGPKITEIRSRHLNGTLAGSHETSQCETCRSIRFVDFEDIFDEKCLSRVLFPKSLLGEYF